MTLPTLSDISSCKNLFCVCKLTCKCVQILEKKNHSSLLILFNLTAASMQLEDLFFCNIASHVFLFLHDCLIPLILLHQSTPLYLAVRSPCIFSFSLPTFFTKEILSVAMPSAALLTVPWEFFSQNMAWLASLDHFL